MSDTRPIKNFCSGAVGASVWMRQTSGGVFYDVTLGRCHKDPATGEVGYSQSFSDRHLDALITVALQARSWIAEKRATDITVAADAA